jgi:predicted GIY-YIG superfamily endonuclease
MAFWVYILKCADGSYYTGHTDDLDKRMAEHQAGEYCTYTREKRPVTLAFAQECSTRIEALESERQIKGWSRGKKEAMIRGDWNEVSRLAKSGNVRGSTGSPRTDPSAGTSSPRTDPPAGTSSPRTGPPAGNGR